MKKLLTLIIASVFSLAFLAQPVSATTAPETFGVEAAILTGCADRATDDEKGDGIICILEFVVDILTVGVGILATIGLGVAGIQYLTAGGSEEQTRKAKRRIFEIVIGLAAYVLIYSILKFILPNFS